MVVRSGLKGLYILAAVALAACSPTGAAQDAPPSAAQAQAAAPAIDPDSGLKLLDVTIVSGEQRYNFVSELADSDEAQARGMMFRTEMGDFEGMLFPSYVPEERSFWMKNTAVPLDIIFIGEDMRITNIEEGVPYSLDPVYSSGPALAVFEIRQGRSEALGIEPGNKVEFVLPE